nr:putative RNA/RNP complex-1-interacting phosphatase [Ipomoea batatas]
MAAISIFHSLHSTRVSHLQLYTKRSFISAVSCRTGDPPEPLKPRTHKEKKGKTLAVVEILGGVEKLGKWLKDSLGPKKKGDWKDLALMSLSFAVYVYISQQIVCAYCAWMSLLKQSL